MKLLFQKKYGNKLSHGGIFFDFSSIFHNNILWLNSFIFKKKKKKRKKKSDLKKKKNENYVQFIEYHSLLFGSDIDWFLKLAVTSEYSLTFALFYLILFHL